ncbi:hypothetical protein LTR08_004528 [Meristemomyces frigidus]|nr:hypothetical protein LTR08_004528 [Meristemomyces frigidus]
MVDEPQQDCHRLGKRELGRHAFENRMPDRIASILAAEDTSNDLAGVIPKLAQLLQSDRDVEVAYMCTDSAVQVSKYPDEGAHFCGYRNMQMMLLSFRWVGPGLSHQRKLTVPQLQDLIEDAWDRGYNAHGRVQTGGIKDTRKHVGTSEAEAVLLSLDVPCTGTAFIGKEAWRELFDFVEGFYSQSLTADMKVRRSMHQTNRPPIFLQRPNHSLTVVGIEKTKSGKRRLLTFDPAWQPPSAMREPLPKEGLSRWSARQLLGRYRKSERYLKRYKQFETLIVD